MQMECLAHETGMSDHAIKMLDKVHTPTILLIDIPLAFVKLDPWPLKPVVKCDHEVLTHFRQTVCKLDCSWDPKHIVP